jgi:hypothetical protein
MSKAEIFIDYMNFSKPRQHIGREQLRALVGGRFQAAANPRFMRVSGGKTIRPVYNNHIFFIFDDGSAALFDTTTRRASSQY